MGKKKRPAQNNTAPARNSTAPAEQPAKPVNEENTAPDTLIIGDADYEQRAIERRLTELGQLREEAALERKEWLRSHRMLFIVIASVLLIGLISVGIKVYNDANNPLSRFNSASAKNLGSSFAFHITADVDGKAMMTYDGAMKVDPSKQRVKVEYEAEYDGYEYRNVLYTVGSETYKGNYYNGQWTISTVTDKVSDFFDFYTDYKVGRFDGGSFLRFTELSSEFSSSELTSFVDSLKGRLSTDSPAAKITSAHNDDGSDSFRCELSLITIAEIIRDEGASTFFRSRDYDSFVRKLEANRETLEAAECTLSCTITASGYLSGLEIVLSGDDGAYRLRCDMSGFGATDPDIPDDFYLASHLEKDAG